MEELWGGYGHENLFEIWFDGGVPLDADDFRERVTAIKNKYQPQAAVFNGYPFFNTTAIRWIGNEDGYAPQETWSTGHEDGAGDPNDAIFCPAEVDSTLQQADQWFYIEVTSLLLN